MYTKNYLTTLLVCFALALTTSCKKDDDPTDPGNGNGNTTASPGTKTPASSTVYMRATIDGNTWEADEVQALQSKISNSAFWSYQAVGYKDNGAVLQIVMQDITGSKINPGIYSWGPNTQYTFTVTYLDGNNQNYILSGNAANMTEVTAASGSTTSGTFSFNLINTMSQQDSIVVTAGTYSSDNYTEVD